METTINKDVPVLTVSQLTHEVKQTLENAFPSIWVQGEVSNAKMHTSGHFYFSLKDSNAQISAVMFRAHASALKKIPKDGDSVVVYGNLNVFPPSGRYQIVAMELRFAGLGELLLKLEELKKKLHQKGWFSKIHKKPIPKMPRRIGVVTSPTGAAIQDIVHVLTRRFSGFNLILNPVKVQGEGAAEEIARAIRQFNERSLVDVIIVGRGGGSIEDLWAFNEEIVAEAIFNSRIPIIAAVGHETDHCIAEYVADIRAPTPSAAAEIVIAEKSQQIDRLSQSRKRLDHSISQMLRSWRHRYEAARKQPIIKNPYAILGPWLQKFDGYRQSLETSGNQFLKQKKLLLEARKKLLYSLSPQSQIEQSKRRLASLEKQLNHTLSQRVTTLNDRLERLAASLHSVDPKNLLSRGYSILFSERDGSVINSVRRVEKGQRLRLLISDGEILSTVQEIVPKDEHKKI